MNCMPPDRCGYWDYHVQLDRCSTTEKPVDVAPNGRRRSHSTDAHFIIGCFLAKVANGASPDARPALQALGGTGRGVHGGPPAG